MHIATLPEKPFVYVVSDVTEALNAVERLCEYSGRDVRMLRGGTDALISAKGVDYGALYARLSLLSDLASGKSSVVVTTETLLQRFPSAERLLGNIIRVKIGDVVDVGKLVDRLSFAGYSAGSIEGQATFRVHGDTLDLWQIGAENPVRIIFFGDEVESIRRLSHETMLGEGTEEEIVIYPATDIFLTEEEAKRVAMAAQRFKKNAPSTVVSRLNEETQRLLLSPSSPLNTYFLPFLDDYTTTLFSFLPKDAMIVFDDSRRTEDKLKLVRNTFLTRVEEMKKTTHLSAHADSIFSMERLNAYSVPVLGFDRITGRVGMFTPQEIFTVNSLALPRFYSDSEGFFERVKQHNVSEIKVRVYVPSKEAKESLCDAFVEHGIGVQENSPDALLSVLVGQIGYGFSYPTEKLVCVGIYDLMRRATAAVRSEKRKRVVFEMPEKGDYVVHEKYGIGLAEGMQRITNSLGEKDYFVILYRDGDRLYLPSEQLSAVEKYTGEDKPKLHRLGGAEFERVKNRIRESVREMAFDLLKLYRSRHQKQGHIYQPDTVWQKEFEEDFEFAETEDQLAAVADIKSDMERGKIMDRLLCGDVGYGKTEVALRAIFKTIIEGKQAALLAPTTILAQQHYNLLCSRFNKYKIKVDILSRFVPQSEQKEALKRIAAGQTSVVVATHRLLGDDIVFHDLGLLVLDEEQRFGVEQKEKLKLYRNTVNILSLSATPIPRTLHMALSGIRDISVLETPPKERLPVETYVTEYTDALLKDAVGREIARGGQVFVLYNHVRGIETFYEHVCDVLGEGVTVTYAHGQMEETLLEDRVRLFFEGKADVLLSTTIIENGVDLPNANTIFVLDADRLGLSQMYQLRGRVGRSNVLAYAYFTVPEGKVLTSNAIKRLEAIMDNTALGSGFGIAMRDLEIRGAGNVLGREQHGQMEKVGYEMYLRLVQEGIDEMQGKSTVRLAETEITAEGDYVLPEKFMPDPKARVSFYKTVATLSSEEEGKAYYRHIREVYGDPPENLQNIIKIAVLKNMGQRLGVKTIRIASTCEIRFADSSCMTDENLFAALEKFGKFGTLLNPTDPPSVSFSYKGDLNKKINLVLQFLQTM